MKTKICCICKKEKETVLFDKNRTRKDGLANYCKECNKIRQRKYYAQNKERYSDIKKISRKKSQDKKRKQYLELMKEQSCKHCNLKDYRVMEWHHLVPEEKKFNIGAAIGSKSWEKILEEIKKCIPLCRNCHAIYHYELKYGRLAC